MHLILSVVYFALGAILINSAPFEEKLKSGSQETRDSYEVSAVQQNSRLIFPLVISRHFIKARNRGFCFRHVSLSLAPGSSSGFKGWLRKYNSGFLAADEKLYLFFRCNPHKVVKKLMLKRAKRSAQNTPTPPLPRPCVNDTVPDDSESSGLYQSGDASVPATRNPLCAQDDSG